MKLGTWFRFGKQASDQTADDRATDAKQNCHYENEMLRAWHDGACNEPDNETDNDGPNDVQHSILVKPQRLTNWSRRSQFFFTHKLLRLSKSGSALTSYRAVVRHCHWEACV